MHTLYALLAGPLAWIAIIVFIGGLLFQLFRRILQAYRDERFIFSYMSLKYGLRSIAHWIIPFAALNWRRHPVLTVATFCFHICLLLAPLFLSAHYVLVDEAIGLNWWVLPDPVADIMTMVVIAACLFFAVRRLARREIRFVTSASDFLLLFFVAAPFISGMISFHQWGDPRVSTILHMVFGEILLVLIPFTRLSHMVFSIFTRSYIGSEFGKVRRAKDW